MNNSHPMISAFTVIKNGNRLGYPWLESVRCVLDYVQHFYIGEGYSEDDTWAWCQALQARWPAKVHLVRQVWPRSVTGFAIGAVTNQIMDLARASGSRWLWLVQSDELWHPEGIGEVQTALAEYPGVDGLECNFLHLQNNFQELQDGAGYTHAIRLVRNLPFIRSYRDAWTFIGCQHPLRLDLEYPIVHANRTWWQNIPLKMRSHADTLYPDLLHYEAAAVSAERLHANTTEVPEKFRLTTSPFAAQLPDLILPTVGWECYRPREELLA